MKLRQTLTGVTLIALAAAGLGNTPATATPAPCATRNTQEDVVAWVHDFVDGVSSTQPGINGKNVGYDIPSYEEVTTFLDGFREAAAGDVLGACRILAPLGYSVNTITDLGTNPQQTYVYLRESPDQAAHKYSHGWGLFLIAQGNASPLA